MSVIVAAGLMGGLALMLVQMTKQQHQTQKKAETGVEITALQQRILRTLYDDKACVNSIGAGRALPSGGTITVNAIKSKNNQDVVVTGGIYGNRLVKIESMTIEVDSFGSGSTQAQAELAVVMGRENRAYTGQKTLTKTFPLTLELDGAGKLAGCVSNAGAVTQGVCTSLGGKWNGSACTLTMAEIGSECPGSTLLKGFDSTGAKLCATAVKDMNCPDGEKVVGFAGGVPVCGSECDWTTPCDVASGETPPPLKNFGDGFGMCLSRRNPSKSVYLWSQMRGQVALHETEGLISAKQAERFRNFANACTNRNRVACEIKWRYETDTAFCRQKYGYEYPTSWQATDISCICTSRPPRHQKDGAWQCSGNTSWDVNDTEGVIRLHQSRWNAACARSAGW